MGLTTLRCVWFRGLCLFQHAYFHHDYCRERYQFPYVRSLSFSAYLLSHRNEGWDGRQTERQERESLGVFLSY